MPSSHGVVEYLIWCSFLHICVLCVMVSPNWNCTLAKITCIWMEQGWKCWRTFSPLHAALPLSKAENIGNVAPYGHIKMREMQHFGRFPLTRSVCCLYVLTVIKYFKGSNRGCFLRSALKSASVIVMGAWMSSIEAFPSVDFSWEKYFYWEHIKVLATEMDL